MYYSLGPNVYIMVGVPGSGKSTVAKELSEQNGAIILSSDSIRKELYGDENIQGDGRFVFKTLFERANNAISNGFDIIIDATNVDRKARKNVFKSLKGEFNATAVFVDTDINECLRRNNLRERVVPEEIIMKFYNRLTIPEKSEGFSNVIIWSKRNKEKFEEKNVEKKELEYAI